MKTMKYENGRHLSVVLDGMINGSFEDDIPKNNDNKPIDNLYFIE